MKLADHPDYDEHERVEFVEDPASGLRAIIAIHNTRLGPAIGGCRMLPYSDDAEALTDVLRLAKGMTYKCAMGRIPFGGGKSVIIGDPRRDKTPALLHAMGDFVESLGGNYISSFDSGTTMEDIRTIGERTAHVGGVGEGVDNASASTAYGVFVSIRTAVRYRLGVEHLRGLRVAVQGLGNVGTRLVSLLHEAGAKLTVTDVENARLQSLPEDVIAVSPEAIYDAPVDVFSPCALGAVVNAHTLPRFRVAVIAGGANNQLATAACGEELRHREILYAPDYVANGGGIIDLHYQINGGTREALWAHLDGMDATLTAIFEESDRAGLPTSVIADRMAQSFFSTTAKQ